MNKRRHRFQISHRYMNRAKYSDCEYMDVGKNQMVRKLTAVEVDEFRAAINRRLDASLARESSPIRRSVV